jgi:hypothetical protein
MNTASHDKEERADSQNGLNSNSIAKIKYHHMFNKQANTQAHNVSHIKFVFLC